MSASRDRGKSCRHAGRLQGRGWERCDQQTSSKLSIKKVRWEMRGGLEGHREQRMTEGGAGGTRGGVPHESARAGARWGECGMSQEQQCYCHLKPHGTHSGPVVPPNPSPCHQHAGIHFTGWCFTRRGHLSPLSQQGEFSFVALQGHYSAQPRSPV